MSAAAKYRAVTDKISGLLGCEVHFRCAVCTDFDLNIQFAKANAVRHVTALDHEHYGLALFQRDLTWLKCEALGGDVDSLWGSIGPGYWGRKPGGYQHRSHKHESNVLSVHSSSS
jgi:hypothetical protein